MEMTPEIAKYSLPGNLAASRRAVSLKCTLLPTNPYKDRQCSLWTRRVALMGSHLNIKTFFHVIKI